jgi:hypothetical protein
LAPFGVAFDSASVYLHESLTIANEIGYCMLINTVQIALGEPYFKQRNLDAATTAFNEALQLAQEAGDKEEA